MRVTVLWNSVKCVRAMALSVRLVRCTSQSIFFFGFLFTSLASTFAGIHIARFHFLIKKDTESGSSSSASGPQLFWNYWLYGYPILIGLWSQLIGAAGASTSKPKYARNTLQIATFFICSLILLGIESYVCYDLTSDYLQKALQRRKIGKKLCAIGHWWSSCHLELAVTICLVILASFIILLSIWSVICCCGSLCCPTNQVEQEPVDEQQVVQQPTAAQGLMMQGTAVMVPMMYSSGLPVVPCRPVPTMGGNVPAMQSNAIPMMQIASGSHPPLTGVPVFYNPAGATAFGH